MTFLVQFLRQEITKHKKCIDFGQVKEIIDYESVYHL